MAVWRTGHEATTIVWRGVTHRFVPDDRWGLRDPQYPPGNRAHGVPRPVIYVIDRQGIVRFKHTGPLTPDVIRSKIEPLLKQLNG